MTHQKQTIRALALVGMPGAGKTLCAKHLEERGFSQFRFGSIIVDEVVRRGQPITPENERVVREEMRREGGMDAIAKRALPELHKRLETNPVIIIDGLYSFSEYKLLREEFEDQMVVIAIVAPRAQRYARLASRTDRPLTAEQAAARDRQEIETLEKGGPIAIADYTLVNDTSPDGLLGKLDALLSELNVQP